MRKLDLKRETFSERYLNVGARIFLNSTTKSGNVEESAHKVELPGLYIKWFDVDPHISTVFLYVTESGLIFDRLDGLELVREGGRFTDGRESFLSEIRVTNDSEFRHGFSRYNVKSEHLDNVLNQVIKANRKP